jgi:hypothetical protein
VTAWDPEDGSPDDVCGKPLVPYTKNGEVWLFCLEHDDPETLGFTPQQEGWNERPA